MARQRGWLPGVMLLLLAGSAGAQEVIDVWPHGLRTAAHAAQETTFRDTPVGTVVINVSVPTLTVFLPDPSKATGTGVIIAPGGYCLALAIEAEGTRVARLLQARGIAAFVLKYRTQEKHSDGIPADLDMDKACRAGTEDAVEAIALVRRHAAGWKLSPRRIGIIGFSAGGMVASGALLHEPVATRPDFAVLAYGAPFGRTHPVPAGLPPVFMAWAQDDATAGTAMEAFRTALEVAGNRPEVHVFAAGGHGFATSRKGTPSDHWFEEMDWWLQAKGFAGAPAR